MSLAVLATKAVLNVKLDKGEKARFELNISVSSTDPGPWTDEATITSQDKSWEVATKVVRKESGGNAGFDNTPTPAPTPEPSPSTTPEPSPSAPSPAPSPVDNTVDTHAESVSDTDSESEHDPVGDADTDSEPDNEPPSTAPHSRY